MRNFRTRYEQLRVKKNVFGISKVLMQAPGKSLTIVGPLLLFHWLPVSTYATFETIFSLSSIAALLLGWGLSAALPHDYLVRTSGQVLSLMRLNFNLAFTGVILLSVILIGTRAYRIWPCDSHDRDFLLLSFLLFAMLSCGLMGQNFVAAILRIREKVGYAAVCEHAVWFVMLLLCAAVWGFNLSLDIKELAICAAINLAIIAVLINGISTKLLHKISGANFNRQEVRHILNRGTPFVAGQLCNVVAGSASRILFMATGNITSSAHSALAMRLSAPLTFFYQALYGAFLKKLFPSAGDARNTGLGVRRFVVMGLMATAMFVQIVLSLISGVVSPGSFPDSPMFYVALFLAPQLLMSLGICEIVSSAGAGTSRHRAYATDMWLGTILSVMIVTILSLVFDDTDLLVACGMGVSWAVYGILAVRSISREANSPQNSHCRRRVRWRLRHVYIWTSCIGAFALLLAANK